MPRRFARQNGQPWADHMAHLNHQMQHTVEAVANKSFDVDALLTDVRQNGVAAIADCDYLVFVPALCPLNLGGVGLELSWLSLACEYHLIGVTAADVVQENFLTVCKSTAAPAVRLQEYVRTIKRNVTVFSADSPLFDETNLGALSFHLVCALQEHATSVRPVPMDIESGAEQDESDKRDDSDKIGPVHTLFVTGEPPTWLCDRDPVGWSVIRTSTLTGLDNNNLSNTQIVNLLENVGADLTHLRQLIPVAQPQKQEDGGKKKRKKKKNEAQITAKQLYLHLQRRRAVRNLPDDTWTKKGSRGNAKGKPPKDDSVARNIASNTIERELDLLRASTCATIEASNARNAAAYEQRKAGGVAVADAPAVALPVVGVPPQKKTKVAESEGPAPAPAKKARKCGNCGTAGHNKSNCPKKAEASGAPEPATKRPKGDDTLAAAAPAPAVTLTPVSKLEKKQHGCGNCGQTGHNARTCPNPPSAKKLAKDAKKAEKAAKKAAKDEEPPRPVNVDNPNNIAVQFVNAAHCRARQCEINNATAAKLNVALPDEKGKEEEAHHVGEPGEGDEQKKDKKKKKLTRDRLKRKVKGDAFNIMAANAGQRVENTLNWGNRPLVDERRVVEELFLHDMLHGAQTKRIEKKRMKRWNGLTQDQKLDKLLQYLKAFRGDGGGPPPILYERASCVLALRAQLVQAGPATPAGLKDVSAAPIASVVPPVSLVRAVAAVATVQVATANELQDYRLARKSDGVLAQEAEAEKQAQRLAEELDCDENSMQDDEWRRTGGKNNEDPQDGQGEENDNDDAIFPQVHDGEEDENAESGSDDENAEVRAALDEIVYEDDFPDEPPEPKPEKERKVNITHPFPGGKARWGIPFIKATIPGMKSLLNDALDLWCKVRNN